MKIDRELCKISTQPEGKKKGGNKVKDGATQSGLLRSGKRLLRVPGVDQVRPKIYKLSFGSSRNSLG